MWRTGLVAPRHVGSSRTRAGTRVPCIGRRILNHCATREAPASILLQEVLAFGMSKSLQGNHFLDVTRHHRSNQAHVDPVGTNLFPNTSVKVYLRSSLAWWRDCLGSEPIIFQGSWLGFEGARCTAPVFSNQVLNELKSKAYISIMLLPPKKKEKKS